MGEKTYTLVEVLKNLRGFDGSGFIVMKARLFDDVIRRLEEADEMEEQLAKLKEAAETSSGESEPKA